MNRPSSMSGSNYRDDPLFEGYIFPDDPNYVAPNISQQTRLLDDDDDPPESPEPVAPAGNVEPEEPKSFHERYVAYCVMFDKYRRRGNQYSRLKRMSANLDEWLAYPIPRQGKPNPRDYTAEESWSPEKTRNWERPFNVSTQSLWDTESDRLVRHTYYFFRQYFQAIGTPRFKMKNLLGFNEHRTVARMSHWAQDSARHRELVVKLPTRSFESKNLRDEQKTFKKLAGAAHCVQTVDARELGIRSPPEFPFDNVDPLDSSSGESSGSESPADEAPPQPRTRKDLLDNDSEAMEEKQARHEMRCNLKSTYLKTRLAMLNLPYELRALHGDIPPFPNEEGREWDDDRKDFLFTEFMENGDLEHLLYRLVEAKEDVPNRVLWSFWLCLIKACIALEYPPRKFHPRRREKTSDDEITGLAAATGNLQVSDNPASTGKVIGDDLFEDIPVPSRRWAGKRLVHFDIDPTNILVGGLDPSAKDDEHSIVPRLKLGDFGNTRKVKPNKRNEYYTEKRVFGKYGFFAPEQFGRDWDYIDPRQVNPFVSLLPNESGKRKSSILSQRRFAAGPELSEQAIAANYGSWTNIWGIALTMWMVITKFRPPLPPERSRFNMLIVDEPVHYCPLLLDDPEYSRVDEELRRTIMECMRHAPHTRPTLVNLLEQAERGAKRHFDGETDDIVKGWIQSMYVEPFFCFLAGGVSESSDDYLPDAPPYIMPDSPNASLSNPDISPDSVSGSDTEPEDQPQSIGFPSVVTPGIWPPGAELPPTGSQGARRGRFSRWWRRLISRRSNGRNSSDDATSTRNRRFSRWTRRLRNEETFAIDIPE
ncbi:hypothetical protein F5Y06DRAFT_286403 [Hypoxylon sp. FL0890]|nr:hypothetical protein F5Y06DRAFT_286403 [Hypoxylon sp. FL0890]